MYKFHIRDEQKGALFLLLILLIIITVSVVISVSLKTDTVAENLENDKVVRVLFVMDDGDGNVLCSNVLVFYPVSKKGAVINIPGDIGAIYRSLGRVDRIEAVYKEKGAEVYKQEIEKLIGSNIPFSAFFDLDSFTKLTDMLGGLRVFIPAPIDTVSETGERWLLPSGAVTLDGDKISTYIRYRIEDESDSDIQERYQNVITALFSMLHDKKASVFRSRNIFKKYTSLLKFNIDYEDSYKLLSLIADMDTESIIRQTVTGQARIVDGQRLVFPFENGEFVKEAVKQTTNMLISTGGTMTSRIYVLEIQNGTTVQGLAHNTAILFQNASYDVLSAINADSNNYEKTVIIDHIGNREIAQMVGDFIRCTNIKEEEVNLSDMENNTAANVDFTIILGKDFDGRYVRAGKGE